VLRPTRGWQPIDLREILRFRDLWWELARRDVRLRYRQTALGVAWVLVQPIAAAGIFSFVFQVMAGLRVDGVSYFAFAFAGLVAWNVFGSTLSKTSACMIGNAALVSKVYFPRLVLPLSTVASTLVDLAVSFAALAVLAGLHGRLALLPLLTVPLWVALLIGVALGVGLVCAALTVAYRDVQYVLPVVIPMLLYATPVAYQSSDVPEPWRTAFYVVNPLASIIDGFRWAVLGTAPPPAVFVAYAVVTAAVSLWMGAVVFRRMERRFADVI
jgi:lipopolysaccharide transport system permease protein